MNVMKMGNKLGLAKSRELNHLLSETHSFQNTSAYVTVLLL